MSKNINVNPGQYKTRGRERQGEDIPHEQQREEMALAERRAQSRPAPRRKGAPTPGLRKRAR
jgi:hypothetical protein